VPVVAGSAAIAIVCTIGPKVGLVQLRVKPKVAGPVPPVNVFVTVMGTTRRVLVMVMVCGVVLMVTGVETLPVNTLGIAVSVAVHSVPVGMFAYVSVSPSVSFPSLRVTGFPSHSKV
jgi:hypothetical protein